MISYSNSDYKWFEFGSVLIKLISSSSYSYTLLIQTRISYYSARKVRKLNRIFIIFLILNLLVNKIFSIYIIYIFNQIELELTRSYSSFFQYLVKSIRAFEPNSNVSNILQDEFQVWNWSSINSSSIPNFLVKFELEPGSIWLDYTPNLNTILYVDYKVEMVCLK